MAVTTKPLSHGEPAGTRQSVSEAPSSILDDHGERPLGAQESARIWRHLSLTGVELFQGSYRNYEFARHFHAIPAIGVVDRGSMRAYCRNAQHHLPPGTVLLLNPGEVHAPGPAGEEGWGFRVFFFEDKAFNEQSIEVAGSVLRFSQPFVQDPRLAMTLLQLHRKLEKNGTALEIESALLVLFSELASRHASTRLLNADKSDGVRIARIREYIDAHYSRDISLADLAAVAERSPYHLLRSFNRTVGLTPHAYLVQVRVEAARRLLRAGNRISAVAASTGFADQSHLTRHFKRILGVTPNRYRGM